MIIPLLDYIEAKRGGFILWQCVHPLNDLAPSKRKSCSGRDYLEIPKKISLLCQIKKHSEECFINAAKQNTRKIKKNNRFVFICNVLFNDFGLLESSPCVQNSSQNKLNVASWTIKSGCVRSQIHIQCSLLIFTLILRM